MDKALNEVLANFLDQPENEFFQMQLTEYLSEYPQALNEVREYICDHIALEQIYGNSADKLIESLSGIISFKPEDEEDFVASVEKKISRKKPKTVINIRDVNTRRIKRPIKKKKSAIPVLIAFSSVAAIIVLAFVFSSGKPNQNFYLSIKESSGSIELKRANKVSKIVNGQEVRKGDILRSDKAENLVLSSLDGNEIHIKGEGEIEVNELNEFKLNKGEAHVVARKQLTLKTEFTSMKAEQGSFSAFARSNETEVHCKDGVLEIVDALTRRFQMLEIDEIYTSPNRNAYLYRLEVVGLTKGRKSVPFIESLEPASSFKLDDIPEKDLNLIVHLWYKGELVKKDVALKLTMDGPKDYVIDFRGTVNSRVESSFPYCLSPDDLGLMPSEGWRPVKGKHTFRIDVMNKGRQVQKSFSVDFEVK